MKLIILSSTNTGTLLLEAERYEIHQVGSLSVSNGQYFLTALGVPKVEPELTNVTSEPSPSAKQLELPLEDTSVSKSTAKRVAVQKKT